MYITFDEYTTLYADMTAQEFNLYAYDACRLADYYTTGVDGFLKLQNAMPEDERNLTAIKRCIIGLTHEIYLLEKAKQNAGTQERGDGTVMGKNIASVSSGSESISYSVQSTVYELATADIELHNRYLEAYATDRLRGVYDKYGVNVLYMGVYPCINEL